MKKAFLGVLTILTAVFVFAAIPRHTLAAAKNIDFWVDEEVKKDLDGDGKDEVMTISDDYPDENNRVFEVKINNQTVKTISRDTANDYDSNWHASVVDMTDYNGRWMIFIEDALYKYEKGKIIPLKNDTGVNLKKIGGYNKKGYCYAYADSTSLCLSYMCDSGKEEKFKVYLKDDTFTFKGGFSITLDTDYWEGKLENSIKLYSKKSAKNKYKVCTLKAGTQVYVKKAYINPIYKVDIDGKTYETAAATWVYVTDDNGNKGWYKAQLDGSDVWSDENGDSLVWIWFKQIFSNGKYAG